MSQPKETLSYLALFRLPGVLRPFSAATLGRLSYGAVGLSLLLIVHQATGSFAVAGTAGGVYGVATLVGPVKSRLMDRRGHRVVTPILGATFAAALLAMAILTKDGIRDPGIYILLSGLAGAFAPPLGPVMRALWASMTEGPDGLERAYSLDTSVEEVLFTVGPLLVAGLVVLGGSILALVVTALLLFAGSLGLATSGTIVTREPEASGGARLLGPMYQPGFRLLAVVVLVSSLGLGAIDVTITARAVQDHDTAAAGWILAALGLGSALGGLAWGRLRHHRRTSTQMATLLIVMVVGLSLAAVTTNLLVLGLVIGLTGTVIAPALILNYVAADRLAGDARDTEATTWINTAGNAGTAAGYGLTGLAIDSVGTIPPMLIGAAMLLVTASLVLIRRNVYDDGEPTPPSEREADNSVQRTSSSYPG